MAEVGKIDPVKVCSQNNTKEATYKDESPNGKEVYTIYEGKKGTNILNKSYDSSGKIVSTVCHISEPMAYEDNKALGFNGKYPDRPDYIPGILEYLGNKF